jgi:hypothetical protein
VLVGKALPRVEISVYRSSSGFPKHPGTLFMASRRPQAHLRWMRQQAPIVSRPCRPRDAVLFLFRTGAGLKSRQARCDNR